VKKLFSTSSAAAQARMGTGRDVPGSQPAFQAWRWQALVHGISAGRLFL